MSLPVKIREREKYRIEQRWNELCSDAVDRMDDSFMGWDKSAYSDTFSRKISEKALKISIGGYDYDDCLELINYAMMLANIKKQKGEIK